MKSETATTAAASPTVRRVLSAGAAQFAGTYLSRSWARRFVLGSLLQRYNPNTARRTARQSGSPSPAPVSQTALDAAVTSTQQRLCKNWQLYPDPLDSISESRIFRLLAYYACGEALLSDEAIEDLESAVRWLPGAPLPLRDAENMERLLEMVGYVERGDNLRRVAYAGALHYTPEAESFVEPHLRGGIRENGGDVFDAIRTTHRGPGYAIDSATTSEVDDAIGVEVDPVTGEQYFIVYVSDATVYCPFDSQLEQATARALVTTTYLPEGVYFMLPKSIVEAATLREDRPCRTFCVRFQIDKTSGELRNYSVHVGWLNTLRRITYDQVQELLEARKATAQAEDAASVEAMEEVEAKFPPPAWLTAKDAEAILQIYDAAQVRFRTRIQRALTHRKAAISSSVPDPLIEVHDKRVTTLTDQIISTQDARLAVAELMIAANEVCSRIAQAERLTIPFRGTRPLSSDHEAARNFREPFGVDVVDSLDTSHIFLAEGMQRSIKELIGVTRAMYSHLPLYHAGLDTTYYTHSTSPLRRYADMLVHHQLKVWLWRTTPPHARKQTALGSAQGASSLSLFPGAAIPEYVMATLCANISARQEHALLLEDGSSRFWTLVFIQQQLREVEASTSGTAEKHYMCLVGETKDITAAPTYPRYNDNESVPFSSAKGSPALTAAAFALLNDDARLRLHRVGALGPPPATPSPPPRRFVSDVYIPELQMAHSVSHHRADVVVGTVVECRVARVQPSQDVLELQVVGLHPGGDERLLERLWFSGVVSHLDS